MNIPLKRPVAGGQDAGRQPVQGSPQQFRGGVPQGGAPTGQSPQMRAQAQTRKNRDDTGAMKIIDFIVRASIYVTVFLMPLFFFSGVPSVLELNKQVLLVVVVGIGFLSWVGKMAWKNEIRFKKNFILVPVVTFLAIFGLSTVFSNYTEQSLWGYFGGEAKSFVTTLFFVALFFLIINNVETKKEATKIVITFIFSGFLVSVYGILQIWGNHLLPGEITKTPFFNTIGSVYVLSAYVGALFLMTLTLFMSDVSKVLKIVLICLSFVFFFVLMVINFKMVWWALILSMAVLFGITILRGEASNGQSRILPMIFLVLTLLMVLRKQPIVSKELPVEVLLNNRTSFKIALNSLRDNPLLGAGPTNYSTVFQLARPDNLGEFWAVNFNDGSSYFLTILSTMGILGALAFLFLVGAGLYYLFKTITGLVSTNKNDSVGYIAAGAGIVWLFSTIILFLYLANISFLFLWWFSLALFVSFSLFESGQERNEFVTTSGTPKSSLALSFVFVLVIIGFVAAIYLQGQKYLAATHFNDALALDAQGEKIEDVSEALGRAVELDPNRDIYYRNLSIALFALANQRIADKGQDLTADDSNFVSGMIRGALDYADQSKLVNPMNAENHVALASVYEGVLITMDQADERAIENLQSAIKLDPSNPALHNRIAGIYIALADFELSNARREKRVEGDELPEKTLEYLGLARESLTNALVLKADYANANLLLAGVYEREGEIAKAIEKEKENREMLFPNAPGVAFRLGLLYYKDGQMENARKEFEGAVELDKNYANARYFLGLVLDQEGNKEGALVQFEKVAILNPNNEGLNLIISNLKAGRNALDGIDEKLEEAVQNQNEETSRQAPNQQPEIAPGVESQPIPAEATPSVEEVDSPVQPEQQ